jgi:predicted GIY-YIG superfamily endonuclease
MATHHYVYILVSVSDPARHYTGLTCSLRHRLSTHNAGQVRHTAKYRPWQIETAICFRCRRKAVDFERYLKSRSGRAFASKHF